MSSQFFEQVPIGQPTAVAAVPAAWVLDPIFHGLARLAANACALPWASIAIIGYGEAWCTATAELPANAIPQPDPFAHYTSQSVEPFEVSDTTADARFRQADLMVGDLTIRSYVGYSLRTTEGKLLGTLAVYGTSPLSLTPAQKTSLLLLAEQAVVLIELHSRQTARALLEGAPIAIYQTDASCNVIYSNAEYSRIFGLKPGDPRDAWIQRIHPDYRQRAREEWEDFCRNPVPARFASFRTQEEDGTVRHFKGRVVAADGVPGWVGMITEFTDVVTVRDSLRKAETMFRNTFDQAPIGIAHADRRGKILRCNQALLNLLGFDEVELSNKTINDITHNDDIARVSEELQHLWNGDIQFVDLEKRYIRKNGTFLWVHMTTALVRDKDSKPEYSVEFLRDITALKESLEELERVYKLLMTASRQAGMAEVATNVLHNVGNILNSINVSASLLTNRLKQSKTPNVSRVAALLQEKGNAAGEFINSDEQGKRIPEYLTALGEQLVKDQKVALDELASLCKNLEHIKDTVAMQQSYAKLCSVSETIAVVDLVEDSLRLNASIFARHGVTLRREFNDVPPITVDKHKVLQILVNLVRNAQHACDESGKSEKIITLRIDRASAGVNICVIDNGMGIREENMSRLFTHGFTTRVSGHGFGLHSAALTAKELGGSLRAMSDGPGCGATFVLELPCSPSVADNI